MSPIYFLRASWFVIKMSQFISPGLSICHQNVTIYFLRASRFVIKMSRDSYNHLKRHLQEKKMKPLLTIIQEHLFIDGKYHITRNFRENLIFAIFANDLKRENMSLLKKLYFKRKFRSWYRYNILLHSFNNFALLHWFQYDVNTSQCISLLIPNTNPPVTGLKSRLTWIQICTGKLMIPKLQVQCIQESLFPSLRTLEKSYLRY